MSLVSAVLNLDSTVDSIMAIHVERYNEFNIQKNLRYTNIQHFLNMMNKDDEITDVLLYRDNAWMQPTWDEKKWYLHR